MNRYLIVSIVFIGTLLTIYSCSKDPISNTVPKNKESVFTPKSETIIIEDGDQGKIERFDSTQVVLTGGSEWDMIKEGSVILSRPLPGAPAGLLRKVMEKEVLNGKVMLKTEEANLPDAFESYTWNYNSKIGTTDIFRDANEITHDTIDTIYTYDLGKIGSLDLTFEMELQFAYQIEMITVVDYNFTQGVTSAMIGFDNFKLNDLSFSKRFLLGGNPMENVESFQGLQDLLEKKVITIALNPFPIDPPTSLVWVQPVMTLKGLLGVMFDAKYENVVRLYNTVPAKGVYHYDGSTGMSNIDRQLPDNFIMEVEVGMEGTIEVETGVRMELGLAPYTRSLFTAGVGLNNSLINTLTGNINAIFRSDGSATFNAGTEFRTDLKVAGDLFIDGDFFGFAPNTIDAQVNVFESQFNLFSYGVQIENCFTTFKGVSISAECRGNNTIDLYFDALTLDPIFNNNDHYKIELSDGSNTTDLGDTYGFRQSHYADGSAFSPGEYDVTFTHLERQQDGSLFETQCRRSYKLTIPDCNATNMTHCGEDGFAIMYDHPYCVYYDVFNGKNWMASSLNYSGGNSDCYDEIPLNCEVYGSLYAFEEAQSVCPPGWHLPSSEEWMTLLSQDESSEVIQEDGKSVVLGAAYELKDSGYWGSHSSTPGFNVKPSGYKDNTGGYNHLGNHAYFWTSTEGGDVDNQTGIGVIFDISTNDVTISSNIKENKFSCRCIQD